MKKLICITLLLAMQLHASLANAATWQAIGGDYNGTQLYAMANSIFEDGVYNGTTASDQILTNSSQGSVCCMTFAFNDWTQYYPGSMSPPQVNLNNQTIDVSSLILTGWSEVPYGSTNFEPAIGWNVGATSPVPFVNNGNGTYPATWIMPSTLNGTDFLDSPGQPMSITFQAAVPLPSALLLFGSCTVSIIGLFGLKKAPLLSGLSRFSVVA